MFVARGGRESTALVSRDVAEKEAVLCRVHSSCLTGHVFVSTEGDSAVHFIAERSVDNGDRSARVAIAATSSSISIGLDRYR